MKRRKSRVPMLLGLLLLVAVIVIGYLYLSGGLGGAGGAAATPTTSSIAVPTAIPRIEVVVANQTIPANTILTLELIDQYFEYRQFPRDEVTMENPVFTFDQLRNKVTLTTVQPDVPIRRSEFMAVSLSHRIPQGKRAVSLVLDEWAYGFVAFGIVEGDFVDLIVSGPIELHFPEPYPPCETQEGPEGEQQILEAMPCPSISPVSLLSVKTVLQDIEVLQVISITESVVEQPPAPQTEQTEEEGPPPTPTPSPPSGWIVILAVTDQQAEVVEFAQDEGMEIDFLVRARGDHSLESTTGITAWILIDTYGVPVPRMIPYEVQPGEVPEGTIP